MTFANVIKGPENGPYACPCCGFLTLDERGYHEVCPVCFWNDDGQDDHDADEVRGGANRGLSLTEARTNFRMIGASDERRRRLVRPALPDEYPPSVPRPDLMVHMRVEDTFALPGRGLAVTGRLKRGEVVEGDRLWLLGVGVRREVTVCGVEWFRKCFGDQVGNGESVGLLLADVAEGDVQRGMVLSSDIATAGPGERWPLSGQQFSGDVGPGHDLAESEVGGVLVPPGDFVVQLRCEAVRWVDDEPFPGIVEVQFTDAAGRRWSLFDKAPIFAAVGDLSPDSAYPVAVSVACVIREGSEASENDAIVTISTSPDSVATSDGLDEFTVKRGQLTRSGHAG